MANISIWLICAAIFIGIQVAMMYANVRLPDAMFYAVTAFLVVLNLITIYILMRKLWYPPTPIDTIKIVS
jgi:hypothetical protein